MRVKRLGILLSVIVLAVASGLFIFWAMGTSWFWGFQISTYEQQDRINPPKPGVVVFTGSSSIRFWRTLSEDMKPLGAINRGFGGSQLFQVNEYAARIVLPYRPKAVVLYAGENDMSWPWHKSADTVLRDFRQFVKIVHTAIPDTRIYYISMKPDPARWGNWPALANANRIIEVYCRTEDRVKFIDVSAAMLDAQGKPRRELFRRDGLHMNGQGYAIWTSIIKSVLLEESVHEEFLGPDNAEIAEVRTGPNFSDFPTSRSCQKSGREPHFCCITNRGPSLAAQVRSDAQHGANAARTLVIDDNDAFRGDCAFRHLECRRDRAIGKQSFSTA